MAREGPHGLGWYCDERRWFLTAEQADARAVASVPVYSAPPVSVVPPATVNKALMWGIYMCWPIALFTRWSSGPFVRWHATQAFRGHWWKLGWGLLVSVLTFGFAIGPWVIYWVLAVFRYHFTAASRACLGEMWPIPALNPAPAA